MRYGHDPRAIDEYPIHDIEHFLAALPVIQAREHPLAEVD